ncbi:MAG: hypothetical protein ACO1NX_00700 [Chitinophagaceae bacterium]
MLQPIPRQTIFQTCPFADVQMAASQQSLLCTLDTRFEEDAAFIKEYVDHLQPFTNERQPTDAGGVLAYASEDAEQYSREKPLALQTFFNTIQASTLYLLTESRLDWSDFLFENEKKKWTFLSLVQYQTEDVGYALAPADLPQCLPLFLFAHPDRAPIFLYADTPVTSLSMFLCKDGNWHLQYHAQDKKVIETAAKESKLLFGDLELCSQYYW